MRPLILALVVSLNFSALAETIPNNRKLGDAMMLLADQSGGLGEFAKKAPAETDAKMFYRVMARPRGGNIVIELLKEKSGSFDAEGVFTPGELTPGKVAIAKPEDMQALHTSYLDALVRVETAFTNISAELEVQNALPAGERKFTQLKLALAKLDEAIKKAHQEFKPPQQ